MAEFVTTEAFKEFSNRMDEANKVQDIRIGKLEITMEKIQSLTVSVEKMAISIDTMAKEISKQGQKLEAIESKPAEKWDKFVWLAVTAIVGAIIGYVLKSLGIG